MKSPEIPEDEPDEEEYTYADLYGKAEPDEDGDAIERSDPDIPLSSFR